MTKKRLALLTTLTAAAYFALLLLLPESIVGTRRTDNALLFVFKIGFLAICAAIVTALILMLNFKREFVKIQLASFNRYKYLLRFLVKRDFVARYRKSVLGILWSLLNPLLTMLIMTMIFSYLFKNQIENFPVYILSGQIIFSFFSESTTLAMNSVIAGEGIIKKVYVPKYIFPLSRVLSSLMNMAFSFIAFLLVFIVTGAPFHWSMLLLPVPIFYTFVFALGISMLMSCMAVFFRDLTYLYTIFLTLLMYLTPLFYPVDILPAWLQPLIGINPMFQFIDYFRSLALYGTVPDLWTNTVCIGYALAALCGGFYVFMSKQDKYILYL